MALRAQVEWLDGEAVRAEIDSPTYLGGAWQKTGVGVPRSGPAGLGTRRGRSRSEARGSYEATPVSGIEADGAGVSCALWAGGSARATRSARDLGVLPIVRSDPPLRRPGLRLRARDGAALSGSSVPLSAGRTARARPTQQPVPLLPADERRPHPLGGYDAVYNFRNGVGPHLDQRPKTFEMLARNFFATFPQLEGIRFTHRWGGAIDTCSRFCMTFGKALGGKVVYVVGFTGLGVGASRFGARAALDLADGIRS